jgi:acid phosphatase type 7
MMANNNARLLKRALLGIFCAFTIAIILWACGSGGASSVAVSPPVVEQNPAPDPKPDPAPAPWEIIAAGDIAQCGTLLPADAVVEKTAKLVERQLSQVGSNTNVLTLGDNVYNVGLLTEYKNCYEPTWGRFLSKTFATPGNHDYGTANAVGYYDYFGASAGPDRNGYYRIDRNGWTIFALNSQTDASNTSAQMQWLKSQLTTAQPCVAAAWHYPVFTSAVRKDNTTMVAVWDVLDKAKADIVLQGHEHHYEKFAPMTATGTVMDTDGIRSFVVGTGGASLNVFAGNRTGSQAQIGAHGVMRLSLSAGIAKWRFIDITDTVRDQGEIACRAK